MRRSERQVGAAQSSESSGEGTFSIRSGVVFYHIRVFRRIVSRISFDIRIIRSICHVFDMCEISNTRMTKYLHVFYNVCDSETVGNKYVFVFTSYLRRILTTS